MGIYTSANNFTASLVGTLYGSMQQQLQSSPRNAQVEASHKQPDSDERQQDPESDSETQETRLSLNSSIKRQSELSDSEKQEVKELKQRDREVRSHEQAHMAAAAGSARGGPSYGYETGPDGRQYAVEGNVSIDISKVPGDPEATVEKARTAKKAATAPADPSAQDMRVAAQATQIEAEAKMEIREQKQKEIEEAAEKAPEEEGPSSRTLSAMDAYSRASALGNSRTPGAAISFAI